MHERFSPADRARSFGFALRGIVTLIRREPNARLHGVATIAVIALGATLELSAADWRWLVVAIALVWCAEALNTAVERLADATAPDPSPLVEQAKDVAAGGVLVAAIGAAVIGLLVLGPPLLAIVATRL